MTDLEMWSLIVGSLLPPLVSILQQPRWHPGLRAVVAVLSSLIAAAITVYLQGDLDLDKNLVTSFLIIVVSAMATYRNFWKPTGVAPAVEASTSPS